MASEASVRGINVMNAGRRFTGGHHRDKSKVITDYVEGKQTKEQLALRYGVSVRTISRDLLGVNGNDKCTDFGNRECSDFGNSNAPISVTTIHNFR